MGVPRFGWAARSRKKKIKLFFEPASAPKSKAGFGAQERAIVRRSRCVRQRNVKHSHRTFEQSRQKKLYRKSAQHAHNICAANVYILLATKSIPGHFCRFIHARIFLSPPEAA